MLPFENMVADYIHETGNHVLYRITPVFEGNNLVASGVEMEAESVPDQGKYFLSCISATNALQSQVLTLYDQGQMGGVTAGPSKKIIFLTMAFMISAKEGRQQAR